MALLDADQLNLEATKIPTVEPPTPEARVFGWREFLPILHVAGGNLAGALIGMMSGILIARWVGPAEMGIWNRAGLIGGYAAWLGIGVFSGLNRDLPFHAGTGDDGRGNQLASAAFGWSLLVAATTAVLASLAVILVARHVGPLDAAACAVVGFGAVVAAINGYHAVIYRTQAAFSSLALRSTIGSIVGLLLTVLVLAWGFGGLLARSAAVTIVGFFVLYIGRPLRVPPRWSPRDVWKLMVTGLPIFALGQLSAVVWSLDRLALAGSVVNLGVFTVAIQIAAAIRIVPSAISAVAFPRLAFAHGAGTSARSMWRTTARYAGVAVGAGIVVAAVAQLMVPLFVETVVPKYRLGVRAGLWTAAQAIPLGLDVFGNLFNVLRRQDVYIAVFGVGFGTFWLAWWAQSAVPNLPLPERAAISMLCCLSVGGLTQAALGWFVCVRADQNA